jgi:hypothetical protein
MGHGTAIMSPGHRSTCWALSLALAAILTAPALGAESTELLPSDTAVVVSVNLRQILDEPWIQKSRSAQKFLDAFRLALQGDERRLKEFYARQEIRKAEVMTEEEFLKWARRFRTYYNARGIDPLKDIDRLTFAFQTAGEGSFVTILEGKFDVARFKAAEKERARKHRGPFKCTRAAGFEVCEGPDPDAPGGRRRVAVSPRVVVEAGSAEQMAGVLARAGGEKKGGLPRPMRALLARAEKEQIAFVMNSCDVVFQAVEQGLDREPASSQDVIGTWVRKRVASWSRKLGKDVQLLSVGLSFKAESFQLQIGLGARSPKAARELRAWVERNNFWVALFLKGADGDAPRMFVDILRKERVTVKDSATFIDAEVPYTFVRTVMAGPWP